MDARTGEHKQTLVGHRDGISSVVFSPDGFTLASGGDYKDKSIRLWDVRTGYHLHTLEGHTGKVSSISFSPDGLTLTSGGGYNPGGHSDKSIQLWDVRTGSHLHTLVESIVGNVFCVAFSPTGFILATDGENSHGQPTIHLWNAHTGDLIRSLSGDMSIASWSLAILA